MKRLRIALVLFVAHRLPGPRAGFGLLRFVRRHGWATWAELDQLESPATPAQEIKPNEQAD